MQDERITTLLQDISLSSDRHYAIVQAVRHAVLAIGDDVTEQVKYGGILFGSPQPFCGVFAYANHVSIEFSHGASLPDEYGLLEGKGKMRRHLKLHGIDDITALRVGHYIALAYTAPR
ncbi:DUF1801 domain-containing protein [Jeongeupia sp. USM3]|uniref:DUF1801 domain-containing protein n=1 Tax=Jeongeupia sp. USM3 TaxID=1906741 RepID=UPI00089DE0B8|nr:DUF1801 domain-containing protein [Jeongeupia sp. USM3]AOY00034.1 hypothetical protein BJP62_05975 [Jeongeupia sp. USM3]